MDSSFRTGTGLADELDLHVTDAAFKLDPSYGRDGELIPLLELRGTATIDGIERPLSETFPVGKGWQVADDGGRIVSAKQTKINSNTAYGRFIDALVECEGAEQILDKIPDASTFNAATWVGFTLHLERTAFPYDFKGDDGKQVKGESKVLLPTEILAHEMVGVQGTLDQAEGETYHPAEGEIPSVYAEAASNADTFEGFIDVAYSLGLEGELYEEHLADQSPTGYYALHSGV